MIKQIIHNSLQHIFPSQCIGCGVFVTFSEGLCHNCWSKVKFINENSCSICSTPFDNETNHSGSICAKCLANRPLYNRHRSVIEYNDLASKLISDFKYNDKTYLQKYFANIIFNRHNHMIQNADIIIPVPLHRKKLLKRKYNQAALIAKLLCKMSGKKYLCDALIKTKNTESQVGLDYKKRISNLKGAISCSANTAKLIENKNIILIDDVMTTGTTINLCCKELLKFNPKNIDVLTLAMSVKGGF